MISQFLLRLAVAVCIPLKVAVLCTCMAIESIDEQRRTNLWDPGRESALGGDLCRKGTGENRTEHD
jgi:hypothetical protein